MKPGFLVFTLAVLTILFFWIDSHPAADINLQAEDPGLTFLPNGLPFPTALFTGVWE